MRIRSPLDSANGAEDRFSVQAHQIGLAAVTEVAFSVFGVISHHSMAAARDPGVAKVQLNGLIIVAANLHQTFGQRDTCIHGPGQLVTTSQPTGKVSCAVSVLATGSAVSIRS